jgi:hypothetical protein
MSDSIVGPSICTDGDRMAAAVVRAIHEQPARTALAHLGEGDFCGLARVAMADISLPIGAIVQMETTSGA